MDEISEDYISSLAYYKKELKARDSDLEKAAIIGKQLLEDRKALELKNAELLNTNEHLKQKKYSLELDLEAQKKTVEAQSSEIELQREECDRLVQKCEKLQKENNGLQQKNYNLVHEQNDQEELQRENNTLKMKVSRQKEQIQCLQQLAEASVNATVMDESTEEADLEFFKLKIAQLQGIVSGYQAELQNSKMEENRLVQHMKELEDNLKDRDCVIKSYFAESRKSKEEIFELQCEIETLKMQQVDVNRKGNSMFAELDDRRLKVEQHCKLLQKKLTTSQENTENAREELSKCKSQLAIMMSMTSRVYQESYINRLEVQVADAKQEIASLTARLNRSVKIQQKLKEEKNPIQCDDDYKYLKVMYEKSEKNAKALENEIMTLRLQNMCHSDSKADTQRWLYHCQDEIDQLKLENIKLKEKLKVCSHHQCKVSQENPAIELSNDVNPTAGENENYFVKAQKRTEYDENEKPNSINASRESTAFRKARKSIRSSKSMFKEWNSVNLDEELSHCTTVDACAESKTGKSISELCLSSPKIKYQPFGFKPSKEDKCAQQ